MKEYLIDYVKQFTDLTQEQLQEIVNQVPIETFPKGTVLLKQDEMPKACYFVLKGCVRQYGVDVNGKEFTYEFYTENQSVTIYNKHNNTKKSQYALSCMEDCVLVVGDLSVEQSMYETHEGLKSIIQNMMESLIGQMQDSHNKFLSSSPEERYQNLIDQRPDLAERVPQHQLASYLGITPESLSRIKRRIKNR